MADHKKVQGSNAKGNKGDKKHPRTTSTRTSRNGTDLERTLGSTIGKESIGHKAAARRGRKAAQQGSTTKNNRPKRSTTRRTTDNTMA
eukprot:12924693-Prorocentrum_lima.AAC.1